VTGPAPMGLDPIGWAIANLHQMLGHDKAAAVLDVPPYDKRDCLICQYEQYPGPDDPRYDSSGLPVDLAAEKERRRLIVIRALSPQKPPGA
jgi:hypothetical protein